MNIQAIITAVTSGIAKIGGIFGNATGLQIGGPIITGLAVIILAFKLSKYIPGWMRLALIIAAIVMFSGGIANIIQSVQGVILK
ncbi:hypothetical protein FACS1894109_21650 [Spirochaetia bacterium]|nr:hypothetical protein FACS1894109_21650 [Spirochaetia bacterium]